MSLCGNCEPDALLMGTRVAIVCSMFMFFCVSFAACWFILEKHYKVFKTLSFAVKADNCSRVNSSIHTILVVPTLMYGVATTSWGESKEPTSSVAFLQVILCITTAYFLCDTLIMIMYRVPMWGVYLAHHLLAVTPYIIYLFISPCGYGLFLLSCFMLVEFTNFTLNPQAWLEQNGQADTRGYAVCFYITFVGWIACRLINPYVMVYYAHTAIYPSIPSENKWCFIPSFVCGYLIVVFCTSVFIFVLCASLRKRWQGSTSFTEVAHHRKDELIKDSPMRTNSDDGDNTDRTSSLVRKGSGNGVNDDEHDRKVGSSAAGNPAAERAPLMEGLESPTRVIAAEAEKQFEALAHAARERAASLGLGGGGGTQRE